MISYGLNLKIDAPLWDLDAEILGITNRGASVENTVDEQAEEPLPDKVTRHFYQNRFDMLQIPVTFDLPVYQDDLFSFRIKPRVGYFYVGNIGFDFMQNLIHRIRHIEEVHLPYITEEYQGLLLGGDLEITSIHRLQVEGGFGLSIKLSDTLLTGYQNSAQYRGSVGFYSHSSSIISVGLGYNWIKPFTGADTHMVDGKLVHNDDVLIHHLLISNIEGPKMFMAFNFGFFNLEYWRTLDGTFGYGTMIFDVMSFFQPKTWKRSDVSLHFGFSKINKIPYKSVKLSFPAGDSDFSFIFQDYYCSTVAEYYFRDPVLGPESFYNRLERIGFLFTLGAMYRVPSEWCGDWITPYLQVSAGIQLREHRIVVDADISAFVVDSTNPIWTHQMMPVIDFEVGSYLIPDGLLVIGDTSLRIKGLLGVTIGLWNNPTINTLESYNDHYNREEVLGELKQVSWRYSIAVVFGTDLR